MVILLVIVPVFTAEITFKVIPGDYNTSTYVFSQNNKNIASWNLTDDDSIAAQTGKVPNGIVRARDEKGKIFMELAIKNNQLNGVCKEYYNTGDIHFLRKYKNNRLNGITREFYQDGDLHFAWSYRDNKLDGDSLEYDEDGRLKGKFTYRKGVKEYIFYY
ncbi:MAG: hypothetical protein PHV30_07935 [Candidatus Margulisbacteria bacterium]|nr:hypothetical protein [Candidatus Margulisiibacteriota bacterium]